MAKPKFKASLFFMDDKSEPRFLFQVLNLGSDRSDELKFIFTHPDSGRGGKYTEGKGGSTEEGIVRFEQEISYHSDGSLLQKMPSYGSRTKTIYKNPHGMGKRRTPLADIVHWEPFAKYTVVDYALCKKPLGEDAILIPDHPGVFDGTPFECALFLGSELMPTPMPLSSKDTAVFRLAGVGDRLDLLCCFYRSDYLGTGKPIFLRQNVIEIRVDHAMGNVAD
jgi:hypothetical protein